LTSQINYPRTVWANTFYDSLGSEIKDAMATPTTKRQDYSEVKRLHYLSKLMGHMSILQLSYAYLLVV
jgi:hypothetical protein